MDIRTNKKTMQQLKLLAYKLLSDALSLWLVVFFAFLVLDGLVPGYFAAFVSFTKIIVVLFALLAGCAFLGRRTGASYAFAPTQPLRKNKSAVAALVISVLLIINATKSLDIPSIVIVAIVTLVILILFYKIFILDEA